MRRKQCTFHRSFFENIQKLPTKKEKAEAYRIILDYALNGTEPDLDSQKPLVAMVFDIARPVLENANKAAERAKKLSERKHVDHTTV